MTEHRTEPGERIERSADQLEEELDRLEDRLDDAKDQLKEREKDARGADAVAGDWEDEAPDRPLGDDPEGAA